MSDDWVPPSDFEEYRLLRILGRGGMGSVWLAQDTLLDRLVAVKWIAHADPTARTRERFAIEARAAARLQHINVVTVHRYGEAAGRPFLVSEYIRGDSLDKLEKPLPWQRCVELGVSLARGLAAAHRHGIVHRDIKPANAILAPDGEVKLVDFGLARLDGDAVPAPSGSPRTSGTPAYMAPEVRRGDPATRRSDVYQVGCVLYELATGRPPLFDTAHHVTPTADIDAPSLVDAERREALAVPSLRERLRDDGAAFADAVDRCLRMEPGERFASGDELRDALEVLRTAATPVERIEGNPYRGLMPFEAEHRALFFGRAAEARAVCERLRSDAFVLVAGDSGVGKSSLCRAAVLPWVADGGLGGETPWRIVRLVPGTRPMHALVTALASGLSLDEDLLAALADQPAALVRELRRAAPGGLVVFVDQLEELVALSDRREASAFAAVVATLAIGAPNLRLLATVRGDFLTRVAELSAMGGEIERAISLLGPLSAAGAREAVVGPARATGVRFESEALVDELVGFVADADRARVVAALPLLAFTLAELWEARDPDSGVISASSLAAIGGVQGALTGHADRVLAQLMPEHRQAARRTLVQLVAPESTRARRNARDLAGDGRTYEAALDALVRGRLVVARGSGEDTTYELAHEGLIESWPTLAALVSETAHARVVVARLASAVGDWERLRRAPDGLWSARQLAELDIVPAHELTAEQRAFVRASRGAITRRRWGRGVLLAMVPVVAVSLYAGAGWLSQRDRDARIAARLSDADRLHGAARVVGRDYTTLRSQALAAFDVGDVARADETWTRALARGAEAGTAYAQTARALEAALLLDTGRSSVRRRLAEVTLERLELAELGHRLAERDDLAGRLALYDPAGELSARRTADGELELAIEPAGATVVQIAAGTGAATPLAHPARLAPGTYVLEARATGRATVRWPVRVAPGERQRIAFTMPLAAQVPAGYVYVPPGRFAFGSLDDEPIRVFFATAPMHDVATDAYLIGATEVTYAQWIEFLDDLSAEERAARAPHIAGSPTVQLDGTLALTRGSDGVYELRFAPASVEYRARAGDPIVYKERDRRVSQDWRQFPVSGISGEDAIAYAAWLDRTGRVPRARLCDEREWERAARGVDGRSYPHGEQLHADDANIDITYGQREGGFGVDVVGAHPASNSVFGLSDTSGNVWDLTRSPTSDAFVMRGGCYYMKGHAAHLANRQEIPGSLRHLHIGVRICADAP
ncbi:MAG TPA: SUMF1/EgtB/PvdO family nonheme iron enzyme [Kofleriaceae bacterium]|nr:SUMF1/EgtB/PvdO family nonheme iron enzyme [Kofleriaceae bacterium]